MAIAKRPNRDQTDIASSDLSEQAVAEFIAGATPKEPLLKRARKTPVLVRFDPEILKRVDQAASRRGVSRSAWIHFMVSRALEEEAG